MIRVLALSLLFLASDPPKDDAAKTAKKEHQGTWVCTSFESDGKKTKEEVFKTITRTVEDDHIVWKRDGKPFAGTTFEIDPKTDPKTIDVIPDGGPSRDKHVLGIYKLDGETLTLCMAAPDAPRPKLFEAKEGSKPTLMTFRRQEPQPRKKEAKKP